MSERDNIMFFVKYPLTGEVKTRLAAEIGAEAACELYKAFVLDMMERLQSARASVSIFFEPADKLAELREWIGRDLEFIPQEGGDIGERMRCAFERSFDAGFAKAVLIGSDIPELTHGHIENAFAALEFDEVVIGPATDGGYYLIGFERDGVAPEIFEAMPWGTPEVFSRTMAVLREFQCKVHELPAMSDVDVKADLAGLAKRLAEGTTQAPRTLACLRECGLAEYQETRNV